MKRDTSSPGSAGVHIVCADVFLSGAKAMLAAEGVHYDLLADVGGKILRIQVKSCSQPTVRQGRPNAPPCYHFITERGRRPPSRTRPARITRYTQEEADVIACVALDIRMVAYFPIVGLFGSGMNLYTPGAPSWPRKGVEQRKRIDAFPFSALVGHFGPPQISRISWKPINSENSENAA